VHAGFLIRLAAGWKNAGNVANRIIYIQFPGRGNNTPERGSYGLLLYGGDDTKVFFVCQ
jgi:hypothetical protein